MWQIFIIICSDVVEDRLIDSTNRKFFNQSFFFFLNKAFSVSRQLSSFSQVIIPVQNGRMKIIQWNYSRLATIAWAKQECNDYYSIFHLFAHVGLGVLLNDPFGESIASISIRSLCLCLSISRYPIKRNSSTDPLVSAELQEWWIDFQFRNRSTKHAGMR